MEVLKYIYKNIDVINDLGAGVKVERIRDDEVDAELLEAFRKKGIARFPALVAPDGKPFIGLKQVIELFEKNINSAKVSNRAGPATDGDDLNEFYLRELYSGVDRRSGNMTVPKDDNDDMNEAPDFQKKMADYQRREPKHRRGAPERNLDHAPRNRAPAPEDNIAESDDDEPVAARPERNRPIRRNEEIALGPTGDAAGDDMDQRMLAAWMSNNGD